MAIAFNSWLSKLKPLFCMSWHRQHSARSTHNVNTDVLREYNLNSNGLVYHIADVKYMKFRMGSLTHIRKSSCWQCMRNIHIIYFPNNRVYLAGLERTFLQPTAHTHLSRSESFFFHIGWLLSIKLWGVRWTVNNIQHAISLNAVFLM